MSMLALALAAMLTPGRVDSPFIPRDIRPETYTYVGLRSKEDFPERWIVGVIRGQVIKVDERSGRLVIRQHIPLRRTIRFKPSNPAVLGDAKRSLGRGPTMAEIRIYGGDRYPEVVMWVANP